MIESFLNKIYCQEVPIIKYKFPVFWVFSINIMKKNI